MPCVQRQQAGLHLQGACAEAVGRWACARRTDSPVARVQDGGSDCLSAQSPLLWATATRWDCSTMKTSSSSGGTLAVPTPRRPNSLRELGAGKARPPLNCNNAVARSSAFLFWAFLRRSSTSSSPSTSRTFTYVVTLGDTLTPECLAAYLQAVIPPAHGLCTAAIGHAFDSSLRGAPGSQVRT